MKPRPLSRMLMSVALLLSAGQLAACNSNGDKTPVPPETSPPAPDTTPTPEPASQPAETQPVAPRPGLSTTPPPPIEEFGQGIVGRVVKLSGNMMPGPGGPRGKTQAISVPLHIFKGKVKMFSKPDPDHPQLTTIAHCQDDGIFRVHLPPGQYTVVAEIDGKLYLNCFEGDGTWCTVTVVKDKWTKTDIKDTSDAAF